MIHFENINSFVVTTSIGITEIFNFIIKAYWLGD